MEICVSPGVYIYFCVFGNTLSLGFNVRVQGSMLRFYGSFERLSCLFAVLLMFVLVFIGRTFVFQLRVPTFSSRHWSSVSGFMASGVRLVGSGFAPATVQVRGVKGGGYGVGIEVRHVGLNGDRIKAGDRRCYEVQGFKTDTFRVCV